MEIADYILDKLPWRERKRIHDCAQNNAARLAQQEEVPVDANKLPYPLQGESGMCCVYATRPPPCRPLHAASISRQCGIETSGADGEIPPWPAHIRTIEDGVREGLIQELDTAGLDANVYELNSALATALDTPDAAERWGKGNDVFAGCQRYR